MGKKVKAAKNSSSKSGTTSKEKNDKKLRKISAEIAELRKKYIKITAKQAKMDVTDYVLKDTPKQKATGREYQCSIKMLRGR